MIALLIILYLIIGLVVGTIAWITWLEETGTFRFEEFIEDMDTGVFWTICLMGIIWPIILIILGLPALFRLIILVVMKMIEENRND